jgi:hypothetical protein
VHANYQDHGRALLAYATRLTGDRTAATMSVPAAEAYFKAGILGLSLCSTPETGNHHASG